MSEFDTVESLRINESSTFVKSAYTVDLEDDLAKLELTTTATEETADNIFEPSEVSSFRKRLTEAQLTDNLSESTVATETIDIIMERTKAESQSFLAEMNAALNNLQNWKDRTMEDDELALDESERPETDLNEFPIPISYDCSAETIRQYRETPDMKEKLNSLQQLVDDCHKREAEIHSEDDDDVKFTSKNLRVDLMRIDFEAGLDSLILASAREKEIMQKELEMDLKMSGLSLALAQAGSELDDILGRVDHK